jgi:hypothetical protein
VVARGEHPFDICYLLFRMSPFPGVENRPAGRAKHSEDYSFG